MSLFDTYIPVPAISCPDCGEDLAFQGKQGPRELWVWKQGYKHPVGSDDAGDYPLNPKGATLPEVFQISGFCKNQQCQSVWFECQCVDEVWQEIVVK